jgi:hypothetical protein
VPVLPGDVHLRAGAWVRVTASAEVVTVALGGALRPDHAGWVELVTARSLSVQRPVCLRADVTRVGAGLGTVAVLARLALVSRRVGCAFDVVGDGAGLRRVATAAGLAEVLGLASHRRDAHAAPEDGRDPP